MSDAVFVALAARLMQKFGAPATLSRVTQTYDPTLDETVTSTASISIFALIEKREVENKGGVKTKQTVLKSNTALTLDDRVTLAGKTYKVESVEETAPNGTAYFYTAVVC